MAWLSNSFANRPVSGTGVGWLSQKFKQQAKTTAAKYQQNAQQVKAQQKVASGQARRWATGNTQVTDLKDRWQKQSYTRALGAFVRTMTAGSPTQRTSIMQGLGNGVYNLTNAFLAPSGLASSGGDGGGGGSGDGGGGYTTSSYADPFYTDMMKWII